MAMEGPSCLDSITNWLPPYPLFSIYIPFCLSLYYATSISLSFKLFIMVNIYFIPSKFWCLTSSAKEIFRIQASIYVGPRVELLMLTCLSKGAKGPFFWNVEFTYIFVLERLFCFFPRDSIHFFFQSWNI